NAEGEQAGTPERLQLGHRDAAVGVALDRARGDLGGEGPGRGERLGGGTEACRGRWSGDAHHAASSSVNSGPAARGGRPNGRGPVGSGRSSCGSEATSFCV